MQPLLVVLILAFTCSFVTADFQTRQSRHIAQLEQDLQLLDEKERAIMAYLEDLRAEIAHSTSRNRRSPRKNMALCGSKLLKYAKTLCSSVVASTEVDYATKCCSEGGCDFKFIKSALCPDE